MTLELSGLEFITPGCDAFRITTCFFEFADGRWASVLAERSPDFVARATWSDRSYWGRPSSVRTMPIAGHQLPDTG